MGNMRVHIASDLHHEFLRDGALGSEALPLAIDADLLILAGDIHASTQTVGLYGQYPVPVLYVHGNHELYGYELFALQHQLRTNLASTSLLFLERDELFKDGVRFLGCCLWTDYNLRPEWRTVALREAEIALNDHKHIRYGRAHAFSPRDAEAEHRKSRLWLEDKLGEFFQGRTVVITHHAPHANSIPPEYEGDILSAAFASDLTPLMKNVDVWVHGHIHRSVDYMVGGCRVICNPRGYPKRHSINPGAHVAFENPKFDPALVIDI
jgi:predicted phosphodiesterase